MQKSGFGIQRFMTAELAHCRRLGGLTVRLALMACVLLATGALLFACAGKPHGATTPTPAPPTPAPEPPAVPRDGSATVPYAIRSADYDIKESGGRPQRMRVTLTLKVSVLRDAAAGTSAWTTVPLLPPEVAVVDCDLREGDGFVKRDSTGTAALFRRPGNFSFTVSFIVAPHTVGEETAISLPLVDAETSKAHLAIQRKGIEFAVPDDAILEKSEEEGKLTSATILPGRGSAASISWFPRGTRRPTGYSLSANEVSLFRFTDGAVRIESLVTCTVGRGTVSNLELTVPAGRSVLKVASEGLKDWRTEDVEGGKVVKLLYGAPRSGEFNVALMQETRTDFLPAAVKIEPVVLTTAERQGGTLALLVPRAILVRETEREGVTRLDSAELLKKAPWVKDAGAIGYQYSQTKYKLALSIERATPKISSKLDTLFRLERGIVQVTVAVEFLVEDAGTFEFSFACPPEFSLSEIVGQNVRDWALKDSVLTVCLQEQALGKCGFSFSGQLPMKKIDGIALALFQTRNTLKQTGHIGVAVEPDIDLTPRAFEDLTQVNPRDLPPWMLTGEGPGRAFEPDSKEAEQWRSQNDALVQQGQRKASLLQQEATPIETRARDVKLGFKFFGFKGALAVSVAEVQPEVAVTHTTTLTIFDSRFLLEDILILDVKKRGVFEALVSLPEGFVVTAVTGNGVSEWSPVSAKQGDGNEPQQVRIKFAQEMREQFGLDIVAERTAAAGATEALTFTGMRVSGAYKEEGTFLVVKSADVEGRFYDLQGAEEIDPKSIGMPVRSEKCEVASAGEPLLGLRFRAHSWKAALRVTRLVPQVAADVFYFLRLREGEMAVDALVVYNIQRAGVGRFVVRLPKGAVNSRLVGEDVRAAHLEDDVWTVVLDGRVRGTYQLYVQFNQRVERAQQGSSEGAEGVAPGHIKFTGLALDGVETEKGTVVVATGLGNMRVTIVDTKEMEKLGRAASLPADMAPYNRLGRLSEFSYTGKAKSLTVKISEMEQAQVETAKVESCELHTVLRETGEAVTYFGCLIQNFNKQFLRVKLGEDAVLWTASVSGKPVKPSLEADGRDGWLLIPILGTDKSLNMFSLELVWVEARARIGAIGGLSFETPELSAGVNELTWQVYVPKDFDVVSESGTMARVETAPVTAPATVFPAMLRHLEDLMDRLWREVGNYVMIALAVGLAVLLVLCLRRVVRWSSARFAVRTQIVVGSVVLCLLIVAAVVLYHREMTRDMIMEMGGGDSYEEDKVRRSMYDRTGPGRAEGARYPHMSTFTETAAMDDLEAFAFDSSSTARTELDDRWVSEADYQKKLDEQQGNFLNNLREVPQGQGGDLNVGQKAAELQQRARQQQQAKSQARKEISLVPPESGFGDEFQATKGAVDMNEKDAEENWETQSEEAFSNIASRAGEKKSKQKAEKISREMEKLRAGFAESEDLGKDLKPGADELADKDNFGGRVDAPGKMPQQPPTPGAPAARPEPGDNTMAPPPEGLGVSSTDTGVALVTAGHATTPATVNAANRDTLNYLLQGLNDAALATTGSAGYVRTKGGHAAGALPIQLSIPTAEITPRVFKQSFTGTGRGTVDLLVVDRSASMIAQIILAVILCAVCVLVARKYTAQTFVVAVALIIGLAAVMPRPETVWYAYLSTVAYALGLGAILAVLAWLCRRIARAL